MDPDSKEKVSKNDDDNEDSIPSHESRTSMNAEKRLESSVSMNSEPLNQDIDKNVDDSVSHEDNPSMNNENQSNKTTTTTTIITTPTTSTSTPKTATTTNSSNMEPLNEEETINVISNSFSTVSVAGSASASASASVSVSVSELVSSNDDKESLMINQSKTLNERKEDKVKKEFVLIDPIQFGIFGVISGSWRDGNANLKQIGAMASTGVGIVAVRSATKATAQNLSIRTIGRTIPIVGILTAGFTTAEVINKSQNESDVQSQIKEQVKEYREGKDLDFGKFISNIILNDVNKRTQVSSGVGYAGDYIASGSSFLILFPPVAIAGFALGTAVKLGGELTGYRQKLVIRNIHDLMAEEIIKHTPVTELYLLLELLEQKGLSADGMYRVETWSFCKALQKYHPESDMLIALERKLISEIDYMSTSEHHEQQLRRELEPIISTGQLTFCCASSEKETIQRVHVTNNAPNVDIVDGLRKRMTQAIKSMQKNHTNPLETSDMVLTLAINRAMTVSMADFDVPSMIIARIAYKLYIHDSNEEEFIACSDQTKCRDCHFIISDTTIEMIRCGVFQVEAVPSTIIYQNSDEHIERHKTNPMFIPILRRVRIPISIDHLRVREEFELLTGKCYKKISDAIKHLPSSGIPKPFVNWKEQTNEFIENQLEIIAFGIMNSQKRIMIQLVEKKDIHSIMTRYFVQIKKRRQNQFLLDSHCIDELHAALAQLIYASNSKSIEGFDKAKVETMLSTRQDVVRNIHVWLSDYVASPDVKNDMDEEVGIEWRNLLKRELLHALEGMENQIMKLIDILMKF